MALKSSVLRISLSQDACPWIWRVYKPKARATPSCAEELAVCSVIDSAHYWGFAASFGSPVQPSLSLRERIRTLRSSLSPSSVLPRRGKKKCMEMNYGNFDGKLGKLHGTSVSFSQVLSWSGVCRAARDGVGNIAVCSRSIEGPPLSDVHDDLQCRFICRVAWACLIYMLIQVYLSVPASAQGQKLACYPALGPSLHTSITNLW